MNEPDVDDFHTLRERIVLTGILTTLTALHIGGGAVEIEAVDLPVVKTHLGDPFIPGSSLKGVVRSTVEGLLRSAGIPGLHACNPLVDDINAKDANCGAHKRRDANLKKHCAACRLFGSYLVASHVRFSDAHLRHPGSSSPLERRDGVSIDRDLRIAADKRKYDLEVVAPNTAFSLEILVQNAEPWLLGLLVAGLDSLQNGMTALGGFTSRGMGRVDISWTTLTRMTAKQMLLGTEPERLDVAATFAEWRAALNAKADGRT